MARDLARCIVELSRAEDKITVDESTFEQIVIHGKHTTQHDLQSALVERIANFLKTAERTNRIILQIWGKRLRQEIPLVVSNTSDPITRALNVLKHIRLHTRRRHTAVLYVAPMDTSNGYSYL